MEAFSQFVKTIAVFLILQAFIGIIMPTSKYKSYIDLILGMVLIAVMLSPLSVILKNVASPLDSLIPKMQLQLNTSAYPVGLQSSQNEMVLAVYENDLKKQLSNLVDRHGKFSLSDAFFEIDKTEENYGEILKADIILKEKQKKQGRDAFLKIEKVEIKIPFGNKTQNQDATEIQSAETDELKNIISNFYNLSVTNIYIRVDAE